MELDQSQLDSIAAILVEKIEGTAPEILERLDRDAPRMLAEHRSLRRGFERRLNSIWGDALDHYWATYVVCTESGEICNDRARTGAIEESDFRFEALTRVHARSCMVASEIHALLRTGHAAGAEARWRTLHELSVVASVLSDAPLEISERYLLHGWISSARDLADYERFRVQLGLEEFDPTEASQIREGRDQLVGRFGRSYKGDWGWSAPLFRHDRIMFSDLEGISGLDHLRPYYRLGSHRVHAGAKGLDLGRVEFRGFDTMLVGPNNSGLAEVGHGALISLVNVTLPLLRSRIEDDVMFLPMMKVAAEMSKRAGDLFGAAAEELARQESEFLAAQRVGPLAVSMLVTGRKAKSGIRWTRKRIERVTSDVKRRQTVVRSKYRKTQAQGGMD